MKIEDYKLLTATNAAELQSKVIEYIKQGYKLAGGAAVTSANTQWGSPTYAQAIYK